MMKDKHLSSYGKCWNVRHDTLLRWVSAADCGVLYEYAKEWF